MDYYRVELSLIKMNQFEAHKEFIEFKSRLTAKTMARKYFRCADVIDVTVIDQTTGEVIYSCSKKNEDEEYDADD